MINNFLIVVLGGSLGSGLRYITASHMTRLFPASFPYGTFIVNISGCMLIGLIYGFSERFDWPSNQFRLFLATGFCGGYTTFSSFTYENIKLLQSGDYLTFSLYSLASFALGLLAGFIGISLTKL